MMTRRIVLLALTLVPHFTSGQTPKADQHERSNKEQLKDLAVRIQNGDTLALKNATEMPADVAIPFLERFVVMHDLKSKQSRLVGDALRKVSNYAEYFRRRLSEATNKGNVDDEAFRLLAAIDTPEAAAVVAPYLFDFTSSGLGGHVPADVNFISAGFALNKMTIEDAPVDKIPNNADDFISWQKWAIAKGYVPKEWKSRIGVPDWLRELTEPGFVSKRNPEGTVHSSIKQEDSPSPQITAVPPQQPQAAVPTPRREEVMMTRSVVTPKVSTSALWLVIGALVGIAALMLLMLRRRK